jgi:6-phosphogluconolactonase
LSREVKIFSTPEELAINFADDLIGMINESSDKNTFTIALSGGNSPKLLFPVIADRCSDSVSWEKVHFFWIDERCVPPGDNESNFGTAKTAFLNRINIPSGNIHRIKGENEPSEEAVRYSSEIAGFNRKRGNQPVFDLIILGLGEDGHTASIFPGNNRLFNSEKICEPVVHPVSLQKRITLTGKVINNADNVVFLVIGKNKAEVVSAILKKKGTFDYPAELVKPETGVVKWYLDGSAAKLVDRKAFL